MTIPRWPDYMLPTLELIKDGKEYQTKDIYSAL